MVLEIWRLLELAFRPENNANVWTYAILAFVASILATRFVLGTKSQRWRTIGVVIGAVAASIYMLVVWQFIPKLQAFETGKVGLLLPRFAGNRLTENFGEQLINEHLEIEIVQRLTDWRLDRYVECRAVSWKPESRDEARDLGTKYKAKMVLWGNVLRLQSSADLSTWMFGTEICYTCIMSGLDSMGVCLPMNFKGEERIALNDSSQSFDEFIDRIASYAIHFSIASIKDFDPELAGRLIDSLPALNATYVALDHSPFVLMASAQFLQSAGRTAEARSRYALAFRYFENLKTRKDDGSGNSKPSEFELRRFAALCKYQEGFCALRLGDSLSAITGFITAAFVDTALAHAASKNFYLLTGNYLDSAEIKDFESPFIPKK